MNYINIYIGIGALSSHIPSNKSTSIDIGSKVYVSGLPLDFVEADLGNILGNIIAPFFRAHFVSIYRCIILCIWENKAY